ncbi:MAG: Palmitoyl-CoA hydrolase, partial [Dactylosporangium sp.]|nr:Palmitoyl-CoA hydrolase [Dactylosporangium sp.]
MADSDVSRLIGLLTLEREGTDVFRPTYYPQTGLSFVFGGQLLAQSLRAAAATVNADRPPHSLHA